MLASLAWVSWYPARGLSKTSRVLEYSTADSMQSRAAPIALAMASGLLDSAADSNLEAGLTRELEGLERIFGTSDALEGLSALIEGRRPSYTNA